MTGRMQDVYFSVPRVIRKTIILVIGLTVLLLGIAMIVLPGPAILVIPFGLIILGIEFVWAKKLLERVKNKIRKKR